MRLGSLACRDLFDNRIDFFLERAGYAQVTHGRRKLLSLRGRDWFCRARGHDSAQDEAWIGGNIPIKGLAARGYDFGRRRGRLSELRSQRLPEESIREQ